MAKFVTVATFGEVPKAEIAKNILEEAGIKAYLSDSELVAMDWLIANAIGGVKVQVAEQDAERALVVLAEAKEMQSNLVDDKIDDDELARQAMAEAPEDEADAEDTNFAQNVAIPAQSDSEGRTVAPLTTETAEVSERDRNAKRAFVVGLLGMGFFPLAIVSLYFLISAAFGTGTITSRGRFNLFVAAIFVVPSVIIASTFTSIFLPIIEHPFTTP